VTCGGVRDVASLHDAQFVRTSFLNTIRLYLTIGVASMNRLALTRIRRIVPGDAALGHTSMAGDGEAFRDKKTDAPTQTW
jgi:hypothetical protein